MGSKNSFLLYNDYMEQFSLLTDEQLGALVRGLMIYHQNGEIPRFEGMVKMAFSFIKSNLDRDDQKYKSACEKNAENGKRGGRPKKDKEDKPEKANGFSQNPKEPKKSERFLEKPKKADIDIDIDIDIEKDIDIEIDIDTKKKTSKKDLVCVLDELSNSLGYSKELRECLKDFVSMREEIKYPLSETSLKATVKKLENFGYKEQEKIRCLNESISNCWRGIFELNAKVDGNGVDDDKSKRNAEAEALVLAKRRQFSEQLKGKDKDIKG